MNKRRTTNSEVSLEERTVMRQTVFEDDGQRGGSCTHLCFAGVNDVEGRVESVSG